MALIGGGGLMIPKLQFLIQCCFHNGFLFFFFLIFIFLLVEKYGTLHEFACHPCAGAMLIFSVSFQF